MNPGPEQRSTEVKIEGRGRCFTDITARVADWVAATGVLSGQVSIFVRHTSASLIIQENADPDVLRDLEHFFSRLVPDADSGGKYGHSQEGPDDMPAHTRSALTLTQVTTGSIDQRHGQVQGRFAGFKVVPHHFKAALEMPGETGDIE